MADMEHIYAFLAAVEGNYRRGYVPSHRLVDGKGRNYIGPKGTEAYGVPYASTGDPAAFTAMDASGVTIGCGVDLGQKSARELRDYGVAENLISKFSPYLGRKRAQALQRLHSFPLLLSAEEASSLSRLVLAGYLDRLARPVYERDSGVKFDHLPKEAQAVVFSGMYHMGPTTPRKKWPRAWRCFTTQDWKNAVFELKHNFTRYPERRRREGCHLEALL